MWYVRTLNGGGLNRDVAVHEGSSEWVVRGLYGLIAREFYFEPWFLKRNDGGTGVVSGYVHLQVVALFTKTSAVPLPD